MEKSNIVNIFTGHIEQLRTTECSQKEKIACFQQIAECIMSPALAGHINYLNHCTTAVNVLLLFCEDLDSVVRMSAEENLNKIFRSLEKNRVSRILMDLYGEIKRNGNQRSLRICLNLFAYYAPRIKEKTIKSYAVRLLACMQVIARRKETQLQETLCEFVKCFGRYLQVGLTDSEACKLFEVFIENIGAECAVKRRCSSQNCISLIENSRNKSLMAKHGLNQVIDLLLADQQPHSVLGCLGFLRVLLPLIIRGFPDDCPDDGDWNSHVSTRSTRSSCQIPAECRQIVEIYDYCLHLLNISHPTSGHGLINAALEVLHSVLQALEAAVSQPDGGVAKTLHELLLGSQPRMQQQRRDLLRRRKSLKNQIFQLHTDDDEDAPAAPEYAAFQLEMLKVCPPQTPAPLGADGGTSCTNEDGGGDGKQSRRPSTTTSAMLHHQYGHIRHATARSISECVDDDNLLATVVGSVEDDSEPPPAEAEAKSKAIASNDDDDAGADNGGAGELEVDDFITFPKINEPPHTPPPSSSASRIDVDNLMDAMLHDDGVVLQLRDSDLLGTSALDDKSQHFSDIDNESFNSIDFEAEITIGGSGRVNEASADEATDAGGKPTSGGDSIGTFFNNLITHSNAATESVSKLFRPASGSKGTPTKSPHPDKSDTLSMTTSLSGGDTLSFTSTASSNRRLELDAADPEPQPAGLARKPSDVSSCASNAYDDTFSRSASVTASTAVLADSNTRNTATAAECSSDEETDNVLRRDKNASATHSQQRVPNVNPFLKDSSPLKQSQPGAPLLTLKIGSLYEQPLVTYTVRLTAARFLLTGQMQGLHEDSTIRVSIKSLSLMVIAQCVRLQPEILQLQLEITEEELKSLLQAEKSEQIVDSSSPKHSSSGDSSSNLSRDYEHLEANPCEVSHSTKKSTPFPPNDELDDTLLLDIKDDHFGPSTCDYKTLFNDPLSRSADPVMLGVQSAPARGENRGLLSKSEIVSPSSTRHTPFQITQAYEDTPPSMEPPRPPKRTKSIRKLMAAGVSARRENTAFEAALPTQDAPQPLADVLLFYKHSDPILRGGVQLIIGNFVEASGAGLAMPLRLDLQRLLAMLLKGLEDDIHTVVIQALNAFDKMFPHVIAKYLTEPACHYPHRQQWWQRQQHQQPREAAGEAHQEQEHKSSKETSRKHQVIADGRSTSAQPFANDAKCPGPSTALWHGIRMPDEDELLDVLLLGDPQMRILSSITSPQAVTKATNVKSQSEGAPSFLISPKLLLDKVRLCRHNKYWLVQNKYAEVISNLNFIPIGHYYNGDDTVAAYEHLFLDELLTLIADDDVRVREHAAICLCRFIIVRSQQQHHQHDEKQSPPDNLSESSDGDSHASAARTAGFETNFALLADFLDYRLFSGMSTHLRQLFVAHGGSSALNCNGLAAGTMSSPMPPPPPTSAYCSPPTTGSKLDDGWWHAHFSSAHKRHPGHEQKLLSKVLYRLANKLMALHDKNLQFGVIYTLKLLLHHFNWLDYEQAWREFNFMDIALKFTYYNFVTASDLNCQNDLIEVAAKIMAGRILSTGCPSALMQSELEQLMQHTLKILNIYYHLFTNQRPLFVAKSQKPDIFVNAKELAIMQSTGYFGNDYVYIKLYNILRSANDSYKITINQESGSLLIGLLRTCLSTLSVCIELHAHDLPSASAATGLSSPSSTGGPGAGSLADGNFPSNAVLKLIEEILQYLGKLINYAPGECIGCLKQLLKYLFAQNYGNRHQDYYAAFIRPYFAARHKSYSSWQLTYPAANINYHRPAPPPPNTAPASATMTPATPGKCVSSTMSSDQQRRNSIVSAENYDDGRPSADSGDGGVGGCLGDGSKDDYRLLGELLINGLQFHTWKSERESECSRHIKMFEPMVIYSMQLFLKMNASVQAPILELLSQLLDLNVTYSVLDSKNVIFDQITNTLELIESGNVRNAQLIIPPIMKFLMQLTHKSDRKLITIPKLISVANSLLANSAIRDCSVQALKALVYELFFVLPASGGGASGVPPTAEVSEKRAHFQSPITVSPVSTPGAYHRLQDASPAGARPLALGDTVPGAAASAAEDLLAQQRELDTQKEVVLGMLEKFIDTGVCQQVLGLLLLRERCNQQMDEATVEQGTPHKGRTLTRAGSGAGDTQPVYTLICRSICEGRYRVDDWRGFYALDAFFRNNGRNVLADSKEFLALLQLLITKDVAKFCDLSYATLTLANVILKTEEIYLVNHIKLYLRNHPASGRAGLTAASRVTAGWPGDGPSTSKAAVAAAASTSTSHAISEINYFGKVLVEKLLTCLDTLIGLVQRHPYRPTRQMSLYCGLVQRFVRAVHDCCVRSRHKDALQSVFRLMLAESEFLDKYYNLIMMHGTPICCWPLVAASLTSSNECAAVNGGSGTLLALQVEVFKLLSAMKMVTSFTFLLPKPHHQHQHQHQQQQHQQQHGTLAYLERRMLAEILYMHGTTPINWKLQQVQHLFDARFVHILIMEHFEFVCDLCKVDEQFYVAWLDAVLQSISDRDQAMPKPFVRLVLQQFGRLCSHFGGHAETAFKCLQVLDHLHYLETEEGGSSSLRWQMERLARRLSSQVSNGAQQQRLAGFVGESSVKDGCQLMVMIRNDLDGSEISTTCRPTDPQVPGQMQTTMAESRIIDEKWLFAQLIKFSSDSHLTDPRQLSRILLEIQSENKLHTIFQNASFDVARLLRHAIVSSSDAMLASFRNNCVQHNPHIHYLQPNPLVRVTSAILMAGLTDCSPDATDTWQPDGQGPVAPWPPERLAVAVIALIECVEHIERAALIYIDARFVDKFVREQLLRPDMVSTLARFLVLCCRRLEALMATADGDGRRGEEFHALLRCIEALLQQPLVWHEVNRQDSGSTMAVAVVQLAGRLAMQVLHTTSFCRKFNGCAKNTIEDYAVFTAQLIETQIDSVATSASGPSGQHGSQASCELLKGCTASKEVMECLIAIGISVLRTDQFYAFAVTPYEIVQQQQRERLATGGAYESPTKRQTAGGNAKLPTIAVESLSDVEILRKFVKRLSIFGFTTRQQFEEYFMTFLLLINKVYDEHMVDEQEQYQIKSTCLEAILELLITYKTFPIVGSSNKRSQFHHTTRLARINCESICLKKLHKVQLLISDMNLFYHPNMERQLSAPADNIIGTRRFDLNQYDLHFVWQQMEAYAQLTPSMGDTAAADRRLTAQLSGESGSDDSTKTASARNYRFFTQQSGVDFKSSSQLIFDVLMQIMEYNHILALPNLVKFCEICESRDQIKWIKDKVARLQETIPMDDTISHQHIIYLLCRTQATLIPSLSQLQHLCSLIGTYLRSSHVFIRNAALAGLLCLLESSSKTNTAIGKLSDELALLRDLIVGYINRHGFLKESSMQCSNTHTKLVWTLNYCLIEWTSKFVPQCNLLSNTVAAATNILKKITNEELYLTILHGLERVVVVTHAPSPGVGETASKGDSAATVLRHKIEKLAVDLLKAENERFAIPALKLLLSCIYVGSAKQLENTELSNGIVQDDPEIIAQQTDKVDILLHCIKSSTREAAWIYGQVLCQIIRDLVPPKEILTKVIKEFVAINQPHCDVIAMVVHQVFRSAIDSSDLQMLQDWLICTLPTFLGLPERKAVWGLSVIFLSASINLHLIKLFPVVLGTGTGAGYGTGQHSHTAQAVYGSATQGWAQRTAPAPPPPPSVSRQQQQQQKLGQHEIALFVTAAQDFHIKLSSAQRMRFQDAFKKFQQNEVYARLLHSLH